MSVKGMLEFAYHTPETVEEAVELLAKYGSDAKVFAGGTDLLPKMKAQVLNPKHVISLKTSSLCVTWNSTRRTDFALAQQSPFGRWKISRL